MQILVNIIFTGSIIVLSALGFALIYQTVRFFHFAHAIIITIGGYSTFVFTTQLGASLAVAIFLSIIVSAFLGCLIEICVYRPFRTKGASELILLLISLGMYIFLQNIISLLFGDETKTLRSVAVQEGLDIFGARITPVQLAAIFVSIAGVILVSVFLRKTKTGCVIRAVAGDPMLASVSGIKSNNIILLVFALGSGLAGLAGILMALDIDMTPTMGMNPLMFGVVAVIIGGVNSIPGIVLGALLLAMAQHLGAWYIGSQWQDAIAFLILIIFLLLKPEGFLGKKVKSATV